MNYKKQFIEVPPRGSAHLQSRLNPQPTAEGSAITNPAVPASAPGEKLPLWLPSSTLSILQDKRRYPKTSARYPGSAFFVRLSAGRTSGREDPLPKTQ
jgi:hypothetical protein